MTPIAVLGESRTSADYEHRPPELDSVRVNYAGGKRRVTCFCREVVDRSIVPHLKADHADLWAAWVQRFIALRAKGFALKRIMRLFRAGSGELLFSWTVIERAIRNAVEAEGAPYSPPPVLSIRSWEPLGFEPPSTTVWNFPRRGDWAVHTGDYRGNWPPQLARALITKFTEPGDLVVDAFAGGGTSLIEAWLLNRRSIGLDISRIALETMRTRLGEMRTLASGDLPWRLLDDCEPVVIDADALLVAPTLQKAGVPVGGVDLLCVHPPYHNSVRYTQADERDLSLISDVGDFIARIREFAVASRTLLSPHGICAVLIGDVRKNGRTLPIGAEVMSTFIDSGYTLRDLIIKTQHRDRSSEFYFSSGGKEYLIAHEYLLLLELGSRQ